MGNPAEPMWRVRRLLAMSPAEVGLRVVRGIVHRAQRSRTPVAQSEMLSAESVLAGPPAAEDVCAWLERELADGRGRLLAGARDVPALSSALSGLGAEPDVLIQRAAQDIGYVQVPAFADQSSRRCLAGKHCVK